MGLQQVATYGVSVVGMNDTHLRSLRTIMHKSFVRSNRSCTIDVELVSPRYDPAYQARTSSIIAMLIAIWDCLVPRHMVMRLGSIA